MSWSLFKVTAVDSKPVVLELRRIADCLETILRLPPYNYNITPSKPLASNASSEEEPTVGYSTDEETGLAELREEFERVHGTNSEEDTDQ